MQTIQCYLIAVVVALVSVTPVFAASDKCQVVEAEGNRLILECRHETGQFEPGTYIKIKTARTSAAIEGC